MYGVGDLVVYGSIGVCRVEAVGASPLPSTATARDYYTLTPLYKDGHIYAPVDTAMFMRPVISRTKAISLIKRTVSCSRCR